MKKLIILGLLLLFSFLFLVGCSNTANIFWEDISVTVEEVTLMPDEPEYGDRIFIHLTARGNPEQEIYGYSLSKYFQIYSPEEQCNGFIPIGKLNTENNLLVKKEIEAYGWTNCHSDKMPEKLTFVFRDSDIDGLDSISDKFTIKVRKSPSKKMDVVIKEWIEEKKEQKKLDEERQAQREKEIEKQQKLKAEYDKYYNEFYTACIDSEDGLTEFIQTNSALNLEIDALEKDLDECLENPDWACESPERWGSLYDQTKVDDHYELSVNPTNSGKEVLQKKINELKESKKKDYLKYKLENHCQEKAKAEVCENHKTICDEMVQTSDINNLFPSLS